MDPTKILAKFKGDFTENPSRWWKLFENFVNLYWDESKFCNAFPLFLEENAQIWFNGLPEDVTDTRENLKCEFLKKYQISHGQNFQKLFDFIDLKQQETESVAEYINRVNALSEDQDVGQFKLTKLQYKCKPELVRLMSLGKWPETVEEAEVRLRSVEANFHYLEKCEKKETEDKIISELKPKIDMMFQQISAVNSKSLQQPTASPPMVEPLLDDPKAKVQHRIRTPRRQRRRNPCYRCGECDHVPSQCRFIRIKCNKCKSIGHKAKNVDQNKTNFRRNQQKFISATGLNNTKASNLIKIRVANHFGMAMVDSGATISAISADFYYANLQKTVPLEKAYLRQLAQVEQLLRAIGQIHVTIEIGRLSMEQTFQVFENFRHSIILGLDFLDQQKARLNFDDKTLVLQSGITEVPLTNGENNDNSICFISLINDEVIPSRSEVIIPVQTVDKSIKSKIGIIEPNPALVGKQNIVGATCLVQIRNNKSFLQVLNPTNAKVRLSKHTKIGKFSEIIENSISSEITDDTIQINSIDKGTQNNNNEAKDVFAINLSELGCTDLHPHRIDTGDAAPVRQKFYRQSPAMKTESSKHIKEMLDNNIIEPSQSEWASPVCLVRKKGSTSSSSASNQPQYRFCIDFRQLNLLCVKRVYPIVQMDDIVDMLGEAKAKFYSTVDMFNGYHQIKLDPDTKHKTAFTCHEGVFEFNRLPFGLSNSPHTFQLVMSEALRGINWKSALGTANGNADALSRRPYGTEIVTITTATVESSTQTEATFIELDPYASICEITTSPKEKVVNDQRTDENFKDVIKYILDKELPIKTRQARKTVIESQDYIIDDDPDSSDPIRNDTQIQRHTNDDRNNDDSDLYLVERIVKKAKRINNKMHYYIKWLGFGNRSNSWEPEENIPPELRHEFKVRMDQTKRIKARKTKR
ncbi:unnamed protein product [Mytilus coruscus]|uniref:Chromo domain-containing protein n=1 Tax=Mytilus coruscus TaxID=42192 RepID=A0A6J8ACC7_MYTCO|nr:unnamed protein product [Mytilus coruscus]